MKKIQALSIEARPLEYMNDPMFWRVNFIENQTDQLYTYKNTTYKKWCITDIEDYDFILEAGNEILPITLDTDLNKSKAYKGKGIYLIEEFKFEHERMRFIYKAIIRKMLTKSHYEPVKKFLIEILDKLSNNELVFPFNFIITTFISRDLVITNEINDFGDLVIYSDIKHNFFQNIDEQRLSGTKLTLEIEPLSKKENEETFLLSNKVYKIKPKLTSTENNFIFTIKDNETGRILDRTMIKNPTFKLNLVRKSNKIRTGKKLLLNLLEGLNIIEKTILDLNKEVVAQEIKSRKEVIELTINSLKAMFADNKVMQAALNVAKEEISLEKEEMSKNKEIVKTAGEVVKTFS